MLLLDHFQPAILHAPKVGHRGQGQGMFHGPRTSSNISFLLRSSLELQKDIPWIDGLHQKTVEERKGKENDRPCCCFDVGSSVEQDYHYLQPANRSMRLQDYQPPPKINPQHMTGGEEESNKGEGLVDVVRVKLVAIRLNGR